MPESKIYGLTSAELIHSPGIYRFALHGYKTGLPPGKDYFVNLIHVGWGVPTDVVESAFKGEIKVTIDDPGALVVINPNEKEPSE